MTAKSLYKVVSQFTQGVVGSASNENMCFMICSPLSTYLNMLSVGNVICEYTLTVNGRDYQHFCIKLDNQQIIDPTASQFNRFPELPTMPDIYIGYLPKHYVEVKPKVKRKRIASNRVNIKQYIRQNNN